MADARLTFPLVPRRRVIALSFGLTRSLRRGPGSDVAGSKPYHPGDDTHAIDWAASARLSTARGTDEFIVRDRFAEEAPKVIIVCDRRPEMAGLGAGYPWLDKPKAMRHSVDLILASSGASGGYVGYLDFADGHAHWRPPKGERKLIELRDQRLWSDEFDGPSDWLERSLAHLAEYPRAITPGTFVFVLSDFIPVPSRETWVSMRERPWDVVPIVIQDPTWEQSFPDVSGITVPLRDPHTGRFQPVRLTQEETLAQRRRNEARRRELVQMLELVDLDAIFLSSSAREDVLSEFLLWSLLRRTGRPTRL